MPAPTSDHSSQWLLRSVEIERDAERLAEMWNASDDQWPGTFCGGVPMTPERIRDWFAREQHVDVAIWDTGAAIAAYCSLWRRPEEEHVAYIALLNVAPTFQGKGLARQLLTNSVEQSIGLGARRLDLSTWSGNLKAVPLYKKCGFFWLPGTSVRMHNYLPTILTMPCARDFFARHDWYATFQRELNQAEDDERWEGLKVFTYRFAAGDDQLTVWVDREARAVTAVETNDFLVAAIADSITPPRGLPVALRWRLTNKRREALPVSLVASGGPELAIDHRAVVTLAPGESTTLTANVDIAAGAAAASMEQAAPAVRSLLVVDGQMIELTTGLRPRPALAVTTDPAVITLTPGIPQPILLQVESFLNHEVAATVSLTPADGLSTDCRQQALVVPANGHVALPAVLQSTGGGVFSLGVALRIDRAEGELPLPTTTLTLFALPVSGLLGAVVDDTIRLENEFCRVILKAEGGRLTIADRVTGKELVTNFGYPAPPAFPSEYRRGRHRLTLESTAGGLVAVAEMASGQYPQFRLQRRITVTSGPVIHVEHTFMNYSATERSFALHQGLHGDGEQAVLTLPMVGGVTQAAWSDFPGQLDDSLNKAAAYAEGWAALSFPSRTIGLIWGDDLDEINEELMLMTRPYRCPPQSHLSPRPLHLYVGDGDWRAVQQLWQRLTGQTAPPLPSVPAAPVAVRFEPPAALTIETTARLRLTIEHRRARSFQGRLVLSLADGWQTDPLPDQLVDVTWQRPYSLEFALTAPVRPGASIGQLRVDTSEGDQTVDLPLIRLGDRQPVHIQEKRSDGQKLLTIANGRLEIDITPGFGGAVSAVRDGGENLLASAFPTVGTLGWLSPWFGGLTPLLMAPDDEDFPGRLAQESFTGEPIESHDRYAIGWSGVRQRAALQRDEWRGLTLELETLTVGNSPVIKQVLRLHNAAPVVRRLSTAGWLMFVQSEAGGNGITVWGPRHQIKASDRITWLRTGAWVAAQQAGSGRTLILIARENQAGLAGWGRDGHHLVLGQALTVPAAGSIELTAYLVVADDLAAARLYCPLSDIM